MMKKKLMAILLIGVMVMAFTACGAAGEEAAPDQTQADQTQAAEEEGQNPVMNYVGPYAADRAVIMIEADGQTDAKVTVTWGSSATESSVWTMSGPFDPEAGSIEYHDCTKTDYVYDDEGNVTSEEEVYVGGHGFLFFHEGDELTLTWQEDQEHAADDMTFVFSPDAA